MAACGDLADRLDVVGDQLGKSGAMAMTDPSSQEADSETGAAPANLPGLPPLRLHHLAARARVMRAAGCDARPLSPLFSACSECWQRIFFSE
jgi:hypothetical protein